MDNVISKLDSDQIIKYAFDEEKRAQRVVIVGEGYSPTYNSQPVTENTKTTYIPQIIKELEIKEIQVPHIIKEIEIKEVYIPQIVKEIEIKEVQVPIVTQKVEIVEKPVIIKEIEIRYIEKPIFNNPWYIKAFIALQALSLFGMLLVSIIKQ